MQKTNITATYCTPIQLKLPVDIETIIDISDPVYTFREVMDHIDLSKYFVMKGNKEGRPRYDCEKLLKIILFAYMENGYASLRTIEKLCKTDIRYMWLLDGMKAPTFMTIDNFMNEMLVDSIENLFRDMNKYIFAVENVDQAHLYIDGSKIEANANKYTWVWKKATTKSRDKLYSKLTALFQEMNSTTLLYHSVQIGLREEYAIEYVEDILIKFKELTNIKEEAIPNGKGHHKTPEQRQFVLLREYLNKLKSYAKHIEICGEKRNSYSKTDNSATFMRIKRDYMGNDQLLPAYNMQIGVADEYIAVVDALQYASDTDCFVPLMEKHKELYGFYPEYPVADAGYGSYNNYLYCEQHGMQKYMKFAMYEKTVKDQEYREDPFRSINFTRNEEGTLLCPAGQTFHFAYSKAIRGNNYGRTEEIYQCDNCDDCHYRNECFKGQGNRKVALNSELTSIHKEVLQNLESTKGALLRMNRSIQAEGVFGSIKWNRSYKRARRRGLKNVIFEFLLISCGFNLFKLYNKRMTAQLVA